MGSSSQGGWLMRRRTTTDHRPPSGPLCLAVVSRRWSVVVILLLLTAPAWAQPPAPMRVMSFNVLAASVRSPAGPWETRRPLAAAVIRRWRPDVVGLQEPTVEQVAQLAEDLPEYAV